MTGAVDLKISNIKSPVKGVFDNTPTVLDASGRVRHTDSSSLTTVNLTGVTSVPVRTSITTTTLEDVTNSGAFGELSDGVINTIYNLVITLINNSNSDDHLNLALATLNSSISSTTTTINGVVL